MVVRMTNVIWLTVNDSERIIAKIRGRKRVKKGVEEREDSMESDSIGTKVFGLFLSTAGKPQGCMSISAGQRFIS